jgi:hypothetical protein
VWINIQQDEARDPVRRRHLGQQGRRLQGATGLPIGSICRPFSRLGQPPGLFHIFAVFPIQRTKDSTNQPRGALAPLHWAQSFSGLFPQVALSTPPALGKKIGQPSERSRSAGPSRLCNSVHSHAPHFILPTVYFNAPTSHRPNPPPAPVFAPTRTIRWRCFCGSAGRVFLPIGRPDSRPIGEKDPQGWPACRCGKNTLERGPRLDNDLPLTMPAGGTLITVNLA